VINFAIVGCGHISKKHAESIEKLPNASLVAVCDTIESNMKPFTEEYGATPYVNYDEMLKDERIDVINICTPSGSHAFLAVKAAEAKKHVIVEKPIALTLKDANTIIEACRENGVKLSVLHPNRFRPAMKKLKEALEHGDLGKLSHANATVRWNRDQAYYDQAPWRGTKTHDGGVLMNQAIHNLDLLVWVMGDIDEVYSMSATRLRNIEAEDVSTGLVKFKNGALGVIETATTIYPKNYEESLSVFGERASIKVGGRTANFIEHWEMEGLSVEERDNLIQEIANDPYGVPGHLCIIEDMIEAIEKDRDPVVTGEDGKKALELVVALYESAEQGKAIKISDVNLMAKGVEQFG
jgi:UDP-N-acetyl-2-amino-2-deoxyglucuronate dehydrogenase